MGKTFITKRFSVYNSIVSIFLFLFLVNGAQAASVGFSKSTVTVGAGSTFTVDATVDAGSDQITSTDMWILYDPLLLEAQSASPSAYFPAVTSIISSGKVYIAGLITEQNTYKTGSGSVAVLTFKGLKNGTATISYDCRADVSNSSKVIKNAVDPTNIIMCNLNGTSVVTIGTGAATAPTAVVPTKLYSSAQTTQPSTLPQTGFWDEMPKLLIAGGLFLMMGIVMRVFLML